MTLTELLAANTAPTEGEVRDLAQAVVPKPFELDDLLTIVKGFVPPPQRGTDAAEC